MSGLVLYIGGLLLVAIGAFMVGRGVGWHARGYYDAAIRDVRAAARQETYKQIEGMIEEELAARATVSETGAARSDAPAA